MVDKTPSTHKLSNDGQGSKCLVWFVHSDLEILSFKHGACCCREKMFGHGKSSSAVTIWEWEKLSNNDSNGSLELSSNTDKDPPARGRNFCRWNSVEGSIPASYDQNQKLSNSPFRVLFTSKIDKFFTWLKKAASVLENKLELAGDLFNLSNF
jgi:hypothetical protein